MNMRVSAHVRDNGLMKKESGSFVFGVVILANPRKELKY